MKFKALNTQQYILSRFNFEHLLNFKSKLQSRYKYEMHTKKPYKKSINSEIVNKSWIKNLKIGGSPDVNFLA